MNITVVGGGYVGFSTALLLAKQHNVTILDINKTIIEKINNRESHLKESDLQKHLSDPNISLTASLPSKKAYKDSDFVLLALPTNYDEESHCFDTKALDQSIDQVFRNSSAVIVIRSTIPIGYTERIAEKYGEEGKERILFSPEFIREGKSYYDVSHPTRIIIGMDISGRKNAIEYGKIMFGACVVTIKDNHIEKPFMPNIIFMGTGEAESVKLFANTYLAMRVTFFNELDAFAEKYNLITRDIIEGVCTDPRIGQGYANPSFGYGGYCLPKDSKQLAEQMKDIPGDLIKSISYANKQRITSIAEKIFRETNGIIGIYGVAMKAGSDNARESAVLQIASILKYAEREVIIYTKSKDVRGLSLDNIGDSDITTSIQEFLEKADYIIANRLSKEDKEALKDVPPEKIYTRDIFGEG